jgi:iron-sulfur cluster repair protein YtfE (RIC family)
MESETLLGLLFAPGNELALTEVEQVDALELLKQDHQKVKGLFKETEGAENSKKKQLFDQIETELEIHAHIEETVFYPAIEKHEELMDMVAVARDEHAEVRTLLQEIEEIGSDMEGFNSKLAQLIETVAHHIEEEQGDMFVKVRELFSDEALEQLGKELHMAKGKQHREAS